MARRPALLDADAIEQLPSPCRTCLFWELGHPRPPDGGAPLDELAGDTVVQKQAWTQAEIASGQAPGRVIRVDDKVVAYALFAAPGTLAPRKRPVPRPSDDALLLATIWVDAQQRRHGFGRLLLQAAVREAIALDLAAVEAFGDRRFREVACVLPSMWLLHEGFTVRAEHPRYPLLRLETRRTARWAESLEHALEGLVEHLPRPHRAPIPADGRQRAVDRPVVDGPGPG